MKHELSRQTDLARTVERMTEVLIRYASGMPVNEICEEFDLSRQTVRRYARMAGLPPRAKGFDEAIRAKVERAYRNQWRIKSIARRFHVSEAYVSKLATELNINRYQKQGPR